MIVGSTKDRIGPNVWSDQRPLSGATRKSFAQTEFFRL